MIRLLIPIAVAASGLLALVAAANAADAPLVVVTAVDAPPHVLTGYPFPVAVSLAERGGAGGTVAVTLSAGGSVLATAFVAVEARGTATSTLSVSLPTAGASTIDVSVGSSTASVAVEAADFQLYTPGWYGPSFSGHGGQFNQNVFAAISRADGVDDANVRTMERSVLVLRPQFSRIFFSPAAFTDPDLMASFVRTVELAQLAGTTVNVTWQGGAFDVAHGAVPKFADVLIDLVQRHHVTNLRWVTIQNEPNSTKITPGQYEAMYRALDPYIQSIRGQVRFMGGDLVQTNQKVWFQYMADHMADLLDAYSIHVFWDYWDTDKLESRLMEVRAIVDAMPDAARKPVYVTEYGVRGLRTFAGAPAGDPGVWADGTQLAETNVAAFQQAWFDILAARLGYAGTSKWDLYFGRYDKGTQAYYMLGGPKTGWPRHPLYNLLYLFTATVKPGWRAAELDQVAGTSRLVAAYAGPAGQLTLVGLDRGGGQLNSTSSGLVPYSIGGLPPSAALRLILWNAIGDGLDGPATTVRADANGVVSFSVPQHAVFALTNVTGSLWPRDGYPAA